jgi:predicted membrane-bound mannosyltransferase
MQNALSVSSSAEEQSHSTSPNQSDHANPPNHGSGGAHGGDTQRSWLTVEHGLYLLIGIAAVVMHLWGLGDRALHHDETLHAVYSWNIYTGKGYMHDPLLHGPFLYYFGAAMYFLFGDTDTTARLGFAIFGIILTLLPFLIRREIGRPAALFASLALLISPAFLYMGRLARHDIYSVVFELLVVIGIVRYAATHRAGWLYLGAAALGLMIANQETAYLFLLIIGIPLIATFLWYTYRPAFAILAATAVAIALFVFVLPGEAKTDGSNNAVRNPSTNQIEVQSPGPLFGWGPLETADNSYALRVRHRADNDAGRSLGENLVLYLSDLWHFFRHPAIILSMVVGIGSLASMIWLIWWRKDKGGTTPWQYARQRNHPVIRAYASLVQDKRVLVAFLIFFGLYTVLFTAFFSNSLGIITGTTGSLLYWLAQHNVERGSQPLHYYGILLFIYEILPLLWAIVGMGIVGTALSRRVDWQHNAQWQWVVAQWRRLLQQQWAQNLIQGKIGAFFRGIGRVIGAVRSFFWMPPVAGEAAGEANEEATDKSIEPTTAPHHDLPHTLYLPLFLIWWSIAAFGIYSWAGEKMPWLSIHLALPITLLGAWACEQIFFRQKTPIPLFAPSHRLKLLVFMGFFFIASGLIYTVMTTFVGSDVETDIPGVLLVFLILVLIVMLIVASGINWGWKWSLSAVALCITLVGGMYTIRNTHRLSYRIGDVPREMMIYTQTSPDVARIARRLEEISIRRTGGLDMAILYDNETVWQWYLRNFPNAKHTGTTISKPPDSDVQAVLILRENVVSSEATRANLEGFLMQRYPLRWWFPEDAIYRLREGWTTKPIENASLLARMIRAPFNDETLSDVWQFFLYRNPNAPLGSTDFFVAVRPGIADQLSLGFGQQ